MQLLHANLFIVMDHEDPINHLTKMDLVDVTRNPQRQLLLLL